MQETTTGRGATPLYTNGGAHTYATNIRAISAMWAGGGLGAAPDPELYAEGTIGCDSAGVAAGLTYHVYGAVGAKAWVATGGTVANLYGG